MGESYYLTGIDVRENDVNSLFVVFGRDYHGREFYGKFERDCFRDNMLKISVVSFVENSEWAWVKPVKGFFNNDSGVIEGIAVSKKDIVGKIE